jgi:multiple sugar transport system permease protein
MTKKVRSAVQAYVLLLPAFLVTLGMMVYPLLITVNLSFRTGSSMNFAKLLTSPLGLKNYIDVFSDPATWRSLSLSLVYTISGTGFAFLIGLATALLLNRLKTMRRLMRILILVPWAIPGVVASICFLWMLDPSYGVVNYILKSIGFIQKNLGWFSDPKLAMVSAIIPTVWKGYPFFTITLLASLQSIPEAYYEAARVDGASSLDLFRHITWPAIQNSAILAIVLNGLWIFRVFDIIYPTTQGGPMGATDILAIRLYNEAFKYFHMAKAATLGILTFGVCALFVFSLFPLLKRKFF